MGYSFRSAARVLLYVPPHRQDSTYHDLCYTSRGALAGTNKATVSSKKTKTKNNNNNKQIAFMKKINTEYQLIILSQLKIRSKRKQIIAVFLDLSKTRSGRIAGKVYC